jgi:molecular chaperone GrpE
MSEHSGDRQTGSRDATEESDTDGGVEESRAADEGDGDSETGLPELLSVLGADVSAQVAPDGRVDPSAVDVDEELRQAVQEREAETLARGLAALGEVVTQFEADLSAERERTSELESRLRRKQAEFQNYKKRQTERIEEERERATEDLVERLLDVRDNLSRALSTDEGADIRGGVETTLDQFDRELDRENVDRIEPSVGEPTDPVRHEVLATVPSDQPADTIADVHRPGYEMAGKVLRPAQVTVSDGQHAPDPAGDADTSNEVGDSPDDVGDETAGERTHTDESGGTTNGSDTDVDETGGT